MTPGSKCHLIEELGSISFVDLSKPGYPENIYDVRGEPPAKPSTGEGRTCSCFSPWLFWVSRPGSHPKMSSFSSSVSETCLSAPVMGQGPSNPWSVYCVPSATWTAVRPSWRELTKSSAVMQCRHFQGGTTAQSKEAVPLSSATYAEDRLPSHSQLTPWGLLNTQVKYWNSPQNRWHFLSSPGVKCAVKKGPLGKVTL